MRPQDLNFSETQLTIHWSDGHKSQYPLVTLRKKCPCATCRGGDFGAIGTMTQHIKEAWVSQYEFVGRYALKFTWNDGHNTGFYTYKYLREICECDQCKK